MAPKAWGNILPSSTEVPPERVKQEASRRISLVMPDFQQRNALAMGMEAIQLYGPDPSDWPEDLQVLNAAIQSKWAKIKAIRFASNYLEGLSPIPADFADDSYWPD